MSQLTRTEFLNRFRSRAIEVAEVSNNSAAASALRAAGSDVDAILAVDRFGPTGRIQGDAELTALFQELRRLSPAGADALLLADRHGNQTNAGRALHALDLLFDGNAGDASSARTNSNGTFATPLRLGAAVGAGQANREDDVRALQQRLSDMGFDIDVDGDYGSQTEGVIRVCVATVHGTDRVHNARARIRPNDDDMMRLLNSDMRWTEMPASGPGFVNHDRDNHDYGWSLLVDTLRDCGARYQREYRSGHPGAARIATNDVSTHRGGDTRDHATHETGLDLDCRLPTTDGGAGTAIGRGNWDKEATYEMIKAFCLDNRVERVLFNSSDLRNRALATGEPWANKIRFADGHSNHFHVDVKPPRFG